MRVLLLRQGKQSVRLMVDLTVPRNAMVGSLATDAELPAMQVWSCLPF